MATGVLGLLREVFTDKKAELQRDSYNRSQEIEKRLAKENPKFREMMKRISRNQEQIDRLREERVALDETRKRLFPKSWDAKGKAEHALREDYLKLRVQTTLDGISKEKVKKLVEDFHNKDYLADAMGA